MKQSLPVRLSCEIIWAVASVLLLPLIHLQATDTPSRTAVPPQGGELDFDHASGFHESAFRLTLSTPVEGAIIYYTTNGTVPVPTTGLRYRESISVSATVIVRAAAFRENIALTDVVTRTFLFVPAILKQSAPQLPVIWGTNAGEPIPAHYAMSENLLSDANSQQEIAKGLHALPTISIVTEPENLFSAQKGIYLHPVERGFEWERGASVEYFDARGVDQFQINCGLRIHGGMSRRPEESPKHSFRLLFKQRYGAAKLHFPLFGVDGVQKFDEVVLRAGGSDSWLDSNGERRRRATYIRDEWMRQSLRAMGHLSARGQFVHVYLDGLYWGIYNLCERPGASLIAASRETPLLDYDILNADKTESGDRVVWDKIMSLANSGLNDPSRYQSIGQYLDLAELADYLILNFYAGNSDWDRSANWYAIRPRIDGGRFQFLIWDAERTFGDVEADTLSADDDESPMRLFHKLSENAAFRALFAARAQRLLFDNGPLAPGPATERFRLLERSVAPALVAEEARWGSYRAAVHQYKTAPYENLSVRDNWQPEVDRILSNYLPWRRDILLDQFRERGLFPSDPNRVGK